MSLAWTDSIPLFFPSLFFVSSFLLSSPLPFFPSFFFPHAEHLVVYIDENYYSPSHSPSSVPGRQAKHLLVHMHEKYEEVRKNVNTLSPESTDTIEHIEKQISAIDDRMEFVKQNVADLQLELQKKAYQLEAQIRLLGGKKLDNLKSRKHLAQATLVQVAWAERFADYITDHTVMRAEIFLESSKHHEKLLHGLLENTVSVDEDQFLDKADLQLEGHLQIVVADEARSLSPPMRKTRERRAEVSRSPPAPPSVPKSKPAKPAPVEKQQAPPAKPKPKKEVPVPGLKTNGKSPFGGEQIVSRRP